MRWSIFQHFFLLLTKPVFALLFVPVFQYLIIGIKIHFIDLNRCFSS
nr:MAG TPA: hypothetical protein [Caudoviricetes sp.]